MSSLSNNNTIAQSMNGLITISSNDITSDTITADTITANTIATTNFSATNMTLQNLTTTVSANLNILTNIFGTANHGSATSFTTTNLYGTTNDYYAFNFVSTQGARRAINDVSTITLTDLFNTTSLPTDASIYRNAGLYLTDTTLAKLQINSVEKLSITTSQTDFTNTFVNNDFTSAFRVTYAGNLRLSVAQTQTDIINATVNLTTTTTNITGTTSNINSASGTVNILNTASTGTCNILTTAANTGTINLGASTSTLNINAPLLPIYNPTSLTSNTQIGYQIAITGTALLSSTTTPKSIATLITLPDGVWAINAMLVTGATTAGYVATYFSLSNATANNARRCDFTTIVATNAFFNNTTIYSLTASSTVYLWSVSSATFTTTSVAGFATRIA